MTTTDTADDLTRIGTTPIESTELTPLAVQAAAMLNCGQVLGPELGKLVPDGATPSGLVTVLDAFTALDLPVPAALVTDLLELVPLVQRLGALNEPLRHFTLQDLTADDYAERFARVTTYRAAIDHVDGALIPARAEAGRLVQAKIRAHVPALMRILSTFYADNAETYHRPSDPDLSGAERDRRLVIRRQIDKAHGAMLFWGGRAYADSGVAAQWCWTWQWSQPAWNRLRYAAPNWAPLAGTDEYEVATTCGARPVLAESMRASAEQARRRQRGFKLWLDNGGGKRAEKLQPEVVDASARQAVAEFAARKETRSEEAELLAESWAEGDQPTF